MTTNETKWAVDPINVPGPRQVKAFNKVIRKLRTIEEEEKVIEGVHGKPETQYTLRTTMLLFTQRNSLSTEKENKIGEAYNWTVSRKNSPTLRRAVEAAILEVEASVPITDNRITSEEYVSKRRQLDEQQQEEAARLQEKHEATKDSHAPIIAKKPSNALALIVAELHEDQSDSQTDYYAHKVTRYVAIGWRSTARESFVQLRRAAAGFPETEHLGPDADKEVEHRENYSMGGGNYLKQGYRHDSGWSVCSYPMTEDGEIGRIMGLNHLEDGIPESPAASDSSTDSATTDISTSDPASDSSSSCINSNQDSGYAISQQTNKRGPFCLVVLDHRVDRVEFEKLRDSAKAANGWYSRKWGKCPGGFGFSSLEEATNWAIETFDTALEPQF